MGRNVSSLRHCGGPYDLTPAHTISSWEFRGVTGGEAAVIAFLEGRPELYVGRRLFHVGIGNGALPQALGSGLRRYVGITISLPELGQFEARFRGADQYAGYLFNKHDPRAYGVIEGRFDIIVDVNLKSYTCCEEHFEALMQFYLDRLSGDGIIVTAESGLRFGWAGKMSVAHTPGADPKPALAEYRVLGAEGLQALCARYRLALAAVPVIGGGRDAEFSDTVWVASRREKPL